MQTIEAVLQGDVKMLKKALTHLKESEQLHVINQAIYNGDAYGTPLHFAAAGNHLECVKLLLDAGADIKVTDNYSLTPLQLHIK